MALSAKYLLEMFGLIATEEATFLAWDQLVVLASEKVGCCMFMPQLMDDVEE